MTFDIQAPNIADLLVFPAVLVVIAGLLLRRRLKTGLSLLIAGSMPGMAAVLLATIDEGAWDRLAELPAAWLIWTLLTLPGTLAGAAALVIVLKVRARRRLGGS